jgi:hypothetical protein
VAGGETLVEAFPEYLPRFRDLFTSIRKALNENESMHQHNEETVPVSDSNEVSAR